MLTTSDGNHGKPWLSGHGKLKMDRGNLMKSSWKKLSFFLYDNVIIYKDREVRTPLYLGPEHSYLSLSPLSLCVCGLCLCVCVSVCVCIMLVSLHVRGRACVPLCVRVSLIPVRPHVLDVSHWVIGAQVRAANVVLRCTGL